MTRLSVSTTALKLNGLPLPTLNTPDCLAVIARRFASTTSPT
jgi:hypothetical protein